MFFRTETHFWLQKKKLSEPFEYGRLYTLSINDRLPAENNSLNNYSPRKCQWQSKPIFTLSISPSRWKWQARTLVYLYHPQQLKMETEKRVIYTVQCTPNFEIAKKGDMCVWCIELKWKKVSGIEIDVLKRRADEFLLFKFLYSFLLICIWSQNDEFIYAYQILK